jgi:DNA polymerase III sliding clamp (beta) subunit (PCNA family)
MKLLVFIILFTAALMTAAHGQKRDDKTAALAVVNQLFTEMAAANPQGIIDLHTPESQLAAIRKTKEGKMRLDVIDRDAFSKLFTDKTAVIKVDVRPQGSGRW